MKGQITIISPGLLGSSIAAACRERGIFERIHVWARRAETLLQCEETEWCDAAFSDMRSAVEGADLVVICTPVDVITDVIGEIKDSLKETAIVTDVGSTKSLICRESKRHFLGNRSPFVGSHPMAGSEKSGLENANAALFQERACFVTPIEQNESGDVLEVCRFWKRLGMDVTTTTPEKHDEIVAAVSHLPHFLASALCLNLKRSNEGIKALAGPGLRDTTRIASGSAPLWKSIFQQNREEVIRSITQFEATLAEMKSALQNESWAELKHHLEVAKRYRDEF